MAHAHGRYTGARVLFIKKLKSIYTMRRFYLSMAFVSLSALGFAQNSPYIKAVDEYVPAPGQFVNELPNLPRTIRPKRQHKPAPKNLQAISKKVLLR